MVQAKWKLWNFCKPPNRSCILNVLGDYCLKISTLQSHEGLFVVKTIRLAEKGPQSWVYGAIKWKLWNFCKPPYRSCILNVLGDYCLKISTLQSHEGLFVVKTIRLAEKCPQSWLYGEAKWKLCNFFQLPYRVVY